MVFHAIDLLNSLRIKEKELPPELISIHEDRLLQRIRQLEERSRGRVIPLAEASGRQAIHHTRQSARRRWLTAAAIILLVASLSFSYLRLRRGGEISTAYGEIREQQLPDGTEITVNANSKIIYSSGWQDGKDREVWLKGEAFFHVSKTPAKSRFIVHTDRFDIIVTGTQFNVLSRSGHANVMLKEGSIIIHTPDDKEMKMLPGDFLAFGSDTPEKRTVRPDSVLAWKEHRLLFDNTPLKQLVTIIDDQYGVRVRLDNEATGNQTISGILPNDNLDVLLQALEATMEFEVDRQGDNITIRKHA
jgi:ferric-dicitrate binding protein FerR (iron transport regulator)